mmetsp:Transcript_54711/g.163524  ORF Transcript_54711/g.163524 Transcript_54711/m.163524 type:complete len:225 (-) Transcript_54711:1937-2611(-)
MSSSNSAARSASIALLMADFRDDHPVLLEAPEWTLLSKLSSDITPPLPSMSAVVAEASLIMAAASPTASQSPASMARSRAVRASGLEEAGAARFRLEPSPDSASISAAAATAASSGTSSRESSSSQTGAAPAAPRVAAAKAAAAAGDPRPCCCGISSAGTNARTSGPPGGGIEGLPPPLFLSLSTLRLASLLAVLWTAARFLWAMERSCIVLNVSTSSSSRPWN